MPDAPRAQGSLDEAVRPPALRPRAATVRRPDQRHHRVISDEERRSMSKGTILITGASSGPRRGDGAPVRRARLRPRAVRAAYRPARGAAAEISVDAPGRPGRAQGARRQRRRRRLPRVQGVRRRVRHARPGHHQRRPGQGRAARHRAVRRQQADRDDELRRRARPDRGRDGDLPRAGQRPPGDDLVGLRAARHAQDDHDVRRHQGRRRRPRRGPPQREREGQGHRRLDHLSRATSARR